MSSSIIPDMIPNWIGGEQTQAVSGETFDKVNPNNGRTLYTVSRSRATDIGRAVESSLSVQPVWSKIPAVKRGEYLFDLAFRLKSYREEMAQIVHLETGKSMKDALAETDGAVQLGLFMAGEGQRLFGRTATSGVPNKYAMTVRMPIGVAGLIIAANTPIANVAWKVFPSLICGNVAILKAAEDTPATAWFFGKLVSEIDLPPGILNIIHGYGDEAGAPLVADPRVGVISFTGSTQVGSQIATIAGHRLARVSLELGGKNPLVVCDDADLENAVKWILLSAFSNAGQRCASASRIILFDSIFEQVKEMLVARADCLKVGTGDEDDFGPVINAQQLENKLSIVKRAHEAGARILIGGYRLTDREHSKGFYMAPTLLDNTDPKSEISVTELFGPIAILYRVKGLSEALDMANDSPYGLTAGIHTQNIHRAMEFVHQVQAGVAVVNAGTYGSEPHMPFGGMKQSGNGTREPGTEALDVYSELKNVYINTTVPEI